MTAFPTAAAPTVAGGRRPPIAWVLLRHELRLTLRDFFDFAARRKKNAPPLASQKTTRRSLRIVLYVAAALALHAVGLVTLAFPRVWHDTAVTRMLVVAFLLVIGSFMLSYTMSRIVVAFHERRDLDLLLCAPIDPSLVLAIRTLAVAGATTMTFAIFVFPIVDVGLLVGRWWLARYYLLVPLMALVCTSVALVVGDAVVRLVGVRRARVGLQVFSALVGASMYFVSQARNFLPVDTTREATRWFASVVRVDDAPAAVAYAAAIARGDLVAWLALIVLAVSGFVAAIAWSRTRFVAIAQMPDVTATAAQPPRNVIVRRFGASFGRGLFVTLLTKEWRLILRAPQLISQVLLQLLYLVPLLFVALGHRGQGGAGNVVTTWGPAALAAGITGVASTLATALAWLTVAAEDAPDLVAGSPHARGTILSAKLVAAALPPVVIVLIAALGTLRRSPVEAAIVLVFGDAGLHQRRDPGCRHARHGQAQRLPEAPQGTRRLGHRRGLAVPPVGGRRRHRRGRPVDRERAADDRGVHRAGVPSAGRAAPVRRGRGVIDACERRVARPCPTLPDPAGAGRRARPRPLRDRPSKPGRPSPEVDRPGDVSLRHRSGRPKRASFSPSASAAGSAAACRSRCAAARRRIRSGADTCRARPSP